VNAGKAFSLEMANVCNNLATLHDDMVRTFLFVVVFCFILVVHMYRYGMCVQADERNAHVRKYGSM